MRRFVIVVVLALCLSGLSLTTPTASAAAGVPIKGAGSGRCLDVSDRNNAPGGKIIIWDCNAQDNQEWSLSSTGELEVYGGDLCLEVADNATTPGSRIQTNTCDGGANQRWKIASGVITAVESNLCLDVIGEKTEKASTVAVWTCNDRPNQKWTTSATSADTTPPSVPASPRVSNLTCNSVTFAWNASTDNVAVAFYDVFHDGQLMKSVSGSTLSTGLTVVAGVNWGLYVNARDAAGNVSQASSTVPIAPPQCQVDSTAPGAPTNLTATVSGTSVSLRWNASTDNISVRAYDIYRAGAKIGTLTGTATTTPATTFIDSGLSAKKSYAYYVVARDGQANASGRSNTVTATTGSDCTNPVCEVTQVGTDTDIPWGLLTLPNDSILYSRRDADTIVRLDPASGAKVTVGRVPNVDGTDGEGGLMGIAIAPSFATDHWLYVMHTSPTDNRIVRFKLNGDTLDTSSEQVLLSGLLRNKFHNGGRLRFGPDGKLYATTGDAQNGDNAQNKDSLNGKILRINTDGSVPSDNPFGNAVWSYGHRNPQGIAFDSQGRLWEQEFGNAVMDETNLIVKGGNYGWPACEGTSGTCGTAGFIAPKYTYPTAEGSCSGIAIVRDVLYLACERGTRMYREVISGSSLTNVQSYFNGTYGRLRTVEPAPDGGLWLTTSTTGDKDSTADNSNEKILHVDLGQ